MKLCIFGYELTIKKEIPDYYPTSQKIEREITRLSPNKGEEILAESNSRYSFDGNILRKEDTIIGRFVKLIIKSDGTYVSIYSDQDVSIEGNFVGDIKAGGDVRSDSTIKGNIQAGGDVSCEDNITGDISCDGDLSCSNISSNGNIKGNDIKIEGDVTANTITANELSCNEIKGNVECNELTCDGDINGNINCKSILRS